MSLVGPNPQPWAHPAPDLETLQLDNFTGLRNKAESRMLFWDSGFRIQDLGPVLLSQIYLYHFHSSTHNFFEYIFFSLSRWQTTRPLSCTSLFYSGQRELDLLSRCHSISSNFTSFTSSPPPRLCWFRLAHLKRRQLS